MSKRALKLHFRIPHYFPPRNEWRKLIHQSAKVACEEKSICYSHNDKLEVHAIFYLKKPAMGIHDLDNRLKDVMDALQGRMGGPKRIRQFKHIIPNDCQVYKLSALKMLPPKQSKNFGHVSIIKHK